MTIMAEQTQEGDYTHIDEPIVKFRLNSDRIVREVIKPEINQTLVHISGYDLQINFNMQFIKSVDYVEAACGGLAQLFGDLIMENLLGNNKKS